jgi:dolichyl-phosphate beta-glucosyltransferase
MLFSIVIPVYNEEKRIPEHIKQIMNFFENQNNLSEIIFVNDGSKDKTLQILEEYKNDFNFTIVSYSENKGKGYAVKQGVLASKGDWVVFFDIDLATPLEEFDHFLSFLNNDDEVVVGSRRLQTSEIKKSESFLRVFLGHGFTKLSNVLVPNIVDFTCGFKCFSRKAAQSIFSRAKICRWGFDTELLYIAMLHGIKIRQMSVVWSHDSQSKVKVGKAIASSLKELVEIKLNQLRGFYN